VDLTLLPSVLPGPAPHGATNGCQYLSSCLLNRRIALDAGVIGFVGTPEEQAAIGHVFLTHSHLDHVGSLPIFLENVYDLRAEPPAVYASRTVLESLQRDLFNERVWPDFIALSQRTRPFLRLVPFEPGDTVTVEGLRITAVPVDHVVPTVGYLIQERDATVAFVPDTGPSDTIWPLAAAATNLRAVVIETTFPEEMTWLAQESRHLTPRLLAAELAKLGREVPTYIMHLKARYRAEVRTQLAALGLARVQVLEPGTTCTF
jgi:ribonuclease BN (tRNA processing enzyme)